MAVASASSSAGLPRQGRALEIAQRAGADAVLAAHISTVTWLTGFVTPVSAGPMPWAHTPIAFLAPDTPPVLIVPEEDGPRAERLGCQAATSPGYAPAALDSSGGAPDV